MHGWLVILGEQTELLHAPWRLPSVGHYRFNDATVLRLKKAFDRVVSLLLIFFALV